MAAFATDVGLLVSKNFRTALAQMSPGSEGLLVPTDNFSDAGLRTYQVFRLDRFAPRQRRRRLIVVAVVVTILLLATAMALCLGVPNRPRPLAHYIGSEVSTVIDHLTRLAHGNP